MKKLLAATLALSLISVLMLSFAGCSSKSDKEFRVGMECAYAPFNWTQTDESNGAVPIEGSSGYAAGYDVELRSGSRRLWQNWYCQTDWSCGRLSSGKVTHYRRCPHSERRESMIFDCYYDSDLVVVVARTVTCNAKSIRFYRARSRAAWHLHTTCSTR